MTAQSVRRMPVFVGAALAAAVFVAGPLGTPALAGELLGQGTFEGRSGHSVGGEVKVLREDGEARVVLGESFSFDGAPDPKLGFAKGGSYVHASQFAPLKANAGRQVYTVPEAIDAGVYDGLFVWCEKYSVALGYAELK